LNPPIRVDRTGISVCAVGLFGSLNPSKSRAEAKMIDWLCSEKGCIFSLPLARLTTRPNPGLSDVGTSQLQPPILDEAFRDDILKSRRRFSADVAESGKA
jgi:hypothetical protein